MTAREKCRTVVLYQFLVMNISVLKIQKHRFPEFFHIHSLRWLRQILVYFTENSTDKVISWFFFNCLEN